MPQRYYNRRSRERGSFTTLELVLTIIVLVAVITTVIVFVFVFHDIPFRTGQP